MERKRAASTSPSPAPSPAAAAGSAASAGLSAEQLEFMERKRAASSSPAPAAVRPRSSSPRPSSRQPTGSPRPSSRQPTVSPRPTSRQASMSPPPASAAAAAPAGLSPEQAAFLERKRTASTSPPPATSPSPAAAPAGLSAEQAAFLERKRAASTSPPPMAAEQGGNGAAPMQRPSFRPSSRSPSPVARRAAQSQPPAASYSPPPPSQQQAWEPAQQAQHTQQAAAPAGRQRTWQDPEFAAQTLAAFPEKSVASVEEARVSAKGGCTANTFSARAINLQWAAARLWMCGPIAKLALQTPTNSAVTAHMFSALLLQCLIEKGGYIFLDVRPPIELEEEGRFAGATNIPLVHVSSHRTAGWLRMLSWGAPGGAYVTGCSLQMSAPMGVCMLRCGRRRIHQQSMHLLSPSRLSPCSPRHISIAHPLHHPAAHPLPISCPSFAPCTG